MGDPKINAVGHAPAPVGTPYGADQMRRDMGDAATALCAGEGDVGDAMELLRKGEQVLVHLNEAETELTQASMQGLRDAIPASTRDGSLRMDEDLAVVPGGVAEPHFHLLGRIGLAAHVGEVAFEGAEIIGLAGHGVGMLGSGLGFLGIGIAAFEIIHDLATAEADGTRDGLIGAAFGGQGYGSPGWSLGMSAALRGLRPTDRDALRSQLPEGIDRTRFDQAFERASSARTDQPGAFEEAAAHYGQAFRNYTDGVAAGLEGWRDDGRGDAFQQGARDGHGRLAEPGGRTVRGVAREIKLDGFKAAMDDSVDEYRYDNDAHYRSGVSHFRRTSAQGPEGLARELSRLDLTSALSAGRARIEG